MIRTETVLKRFKHVCWYPSAGNDFRPLLYLSEWYYRRKNVSYEDKQELPDLFVFTDVEGLYGCEAGVGEDAYPQIRKGYCNPGACLRSVSSYPDRSTRIIVNSFEKLQDLHLTFDPDKTAFACNSDYNSSYLMNVHVVSHISGVINEFDTTVLYITAQNESFAYEFIIPKRIKIEYLVLIRYGSSFGGANYGPSWIMNEYKNLGVDYLLSERYYVSDALKGESFNALPSFKEVYSIEGARKSDYNEAAWYKLT